MRGEERIEGSREPDVAGGDKASDERHESDYDTAKAVTRDEAGVLLAEAERFVERVAKHLDGSPVA